MKSRLLPLARVLTALVVVAVLVLLFAGSELVPAFVLYLALAILCLPGALLLRRRRSRPDAPRLDLTPRD